MARPKGRKTTLWSAARVDLLGKMPDSDIAVVVGVSETNVRDQRSRLGIPTYESQSGKRSNALASTAKHHRPCVNCGKLFATPPSSRVVCCSAACSQVRRERFRGRGSQSDKRRKINKTASAEAADAINLTKGNAAASAKARANPASHHEAKVWYVQDPGGKNHLIANMRAWLREQIGEDEGDKVYAGMRRITQHLRHPERYRPVSHSKGWRILLLPEEVLLACEKHYGIHASATKTLDKSSPIAKT